MPTDQADLDNSSIETPFSGNFRLWQVDIENRPSHCSGSFFFLFVVWVTEEVSGQLELGMGVGGERDTRWGEEVEAGKTLVGPSYSNGKMTGY